MLRSKKYLAAALLPVSLLATSCRSGQTMWAACEPGNDPWGTDGTYVLLCRNGVWEPVMTVSEYLQLRSGKKITIAAVPTRPTTTTTTTAAPSAPATTTTAAPATTTTAAPVTTTTAAPTTTTTSTTTTTVAAVSPVVDTLGPDQGPTSGGANLAIFGSGFTTTTAVSIGGVAATSFTVVSDTQIDAVTPAHAAGVVAVAVTNPAGTDTLANSYTYRAQPTVSAVSPNAGDVAGGTIVTVTGTGFVVGSTEVYIDGVQRSATVVNPTQLTFVTPAHAIGVVAVRVNNYGGISDIDANSAFTYTDLFNA